MAKRCLSNPSAASPRTSARWICALLLAVASCGGAPKPRYTLQTVMFEVDIQRKKLEGALLTQGGEETAALAAQKIRAWFDDPAIPYYLERSDLRGTPEQFRAHEAAALKTLDALIASLQGGAMQEARDTYPDLERGCNACHAVFRPDLMPR